MFRAILTAALAALLIWFHAPSDAAAQARQTVQTPTVQTPTVQTPNTVRAPDAEARPIRLTLDPIRAISCAPAPATRPFDPPSCAAEGTPSCPDSVELRTPGRAGVSDCPVSCSLFDTPAGQFSAGPGARCGCFFDRDACVPRQPPQ
ncbi:MAG: hypothetical protein ACFE0P_11190 [Oceanicaulis sp.]